MEALKFLTLQKNYIIFFCERGVALVHTSPRSDFAVCINRWLQRKRFKAVFGSVSVDKYKLKMLIIYNYKVNHNIISNTIF